MIKRIGQQCGMTCLFLLVVPAAVRAEPSKEAMRVAENMLLHQRSNGGWSKSYDEKAELTTEQKRRALEQKDRKDTTFDNGATHSEVKYLARTYDRTGDERFREAALRGIDFMLEAQYDNGGWPQFHPDLNGYHKHITFNDGAMIGVMTVLRDIARQRREYRFVDAERRAKAAEAVRKGIRCILKCQIVTNGRRTAWCAQHDRETFAPAKARSYELPSISGSESVGIVRFLMGVEEPSDEVVDAIQSAVAWFDRAKLVGIKQVRQEDASKPGGWDKVVVRDPSAPPMWARFYDIETNKPIFCSRDGIPKATLAEISHERRTGYSWLGNYAGSLLTKDYPAWCKKVGQPSVLR